MRKGLTIQGEHRCWQAWFTAYGNQICPLQPFIYPYSENSAERVDDQINKSGSQDNDALFAMVNMDNGLPQIFYAGCKQWLHTHPNTTDIRREQLLPLCSDGLKNKQVCSICARYTRRQKAKPTWKNLSNFCFKKFIPIRLTNHTCCCTTQLPARLLA